MKLNEGFKGILLSLHDRWFHPTDTVAKEYTMFNLELIKGLLKKKKWYTISLKWESTHSFDRGNCQLIIDHKPIGSPSPLRFKPVNGICHVRLVLDANSGINEGVLTASIKTEVF